MFSEKMEKQKKKYKKRSGWSKYAEAVLLEIWAEKVGELRGNRKNSHIYAEMAQTLNDSGMAITAEDVRVEIKNLTAKYRMEKSAIGPSGGARSEWCYYEQIHSLLGSFRCENTQNYVEDSLGGSISLSSTAPSGSMMTSTPEPSPTSDEATFSWQPAATHSGPSSLSSPDCPSPASLAPSAVKKVKKADFQQEVVNHLQQIESRVENYSCDSMAIERESLNVLKNFVDCSIEFNKQVLELLKK